MLRCAQTSLPENFPAGVGNADMSVLERRATLQRLYQEKQQHVNSSSSQITMSLFQCQSLMSSLPIHHHSLDDNSQNLGFTCPEVTTTNGSANSSRDQQRAGSTRKRKAEFQAEEELKDKTAEGREAGEVESGITVKSEKENSGRNSRENSKASDVVQKTEYIHVRARRGQATDSHSLAEREGKIGKKMKCLQDLVPGCNKVTGKAGMLDEIINYVQSLQKQVEFLSMKLATLNPRLDFNIDNLFAKEIPAYVASFPTSVTPMEVVHSALVHYNQGQQESTSPGLVLAMNPTHQMLQQNAATSSMLFSEAYLDSLSSLSQVQQMSTWDSDWQSLFNVGFH